MIYITGDTHARWKERLNKHNFPEQEYMTKKDYVIILGDFGIWTGSPEEQDALDWLNKRNFTTLFIDGNHENFNELNSYPVKKWKGGNVHVIRPSVLHLMRGQVFTINKKKFFTFGGASSHDIRDGILDPILDIEKIKAWRSDRMKMFRVRNVSWWEQELPSEEEMRTGFDTLKEHEYKVDYILTHSPYSSLLSQMDGGSGFYETDYLTEYLQTIKQLTDYKQWFFGHMHVNNTYYWERSTCLYEQISRLL